MDNSVSNCNLFISPKDVGEECVTHSKSNKIKVRPYDNTNKGVDELFKSLLSRYQIGLEASMKEREWFCFRCSSPVVLKISTGKC